MLVDDPLDLALVIVRVVHIVRAAGDGAVFVAVAVAFGSFVGRFVRAGAGGHVPIGAERRHQSLEGIARAQPGDGVRVGRIVVRVGGGGGRGGGPRGAQLVRDRRVFIGTAAAAPAAPATAACETAAPAAPAPTSLPLPRPSADEALLPRLCARERLPLLPALLVRRHRALR